MKTNIELVKHCEKALRENWRYLWGAFGQMATQSLIDNNIRQYPNNERWRAYVSAAIGKTRVCDCYGLVKRFLWWQGDNANPKYNAAQDRNTLGAWNAAKEKGLLGSMPELPGVILYMPGHVGVYCGGGRFIEIAGGGKGMIEGRIANGAVAKGSRFTHWFKDTYITYKETEVRYMSQQGKIAVEGKVVDTETINYNGQTYVKVQDLNKSERLNVQWLPDKGYSNITVKK